MAPMAARDIAKTSVQHQTTYVNDVFISASPSTPEKGSGDLVRVAPIAQWEKQTNTSGTPQGSTRGELLGLYAVPVCQDQATHLPHPQRHIFRSEDPRAERNLGPRSSTQAGLDLSRCPFSRHDTTRPNHLWRFITEAVTIRNDAHKLVSVSARYDSERERGESGRYSLTRADLGRSGKAQHLPMAFTRVALNKHHAAQG